jgi:hypothetical protein
VRRSGLFRKTAKRLLDESIHWHRFIARRQDGQLAALDRLLCTVRTLTKLLCPGDRPSDNRLQLALGLLALARHHADWLRPVETWSPPNQSHWPVFTSLVHHLFALYPVPAFMTSVWFERPANELLPQHAWYKHLGLGQNIRTAGLPLRLTKTMAHMFTQAPHHWSAIIALRWAQVRGLGGAETLARAVIGTRLGKVLENEDFWESVLHFFINNPSLELTHIGPIVDFLQHQKFEWKDGVSPLGEFGKQPPPRPDYTMKGRTVASILRQVGEWHAQLGVYTAQHVVTWPRSPIQGFQQVDGSEELENIHVWTITELLNSRALFLEGQAMRHCVAIYTAQCAHRKTSIWSMQVENSRGRRRVLTIEVDLTNRIVRQIRRKCNAMPNAAEREIVAKWAAQERLKLAEWL